LTVPSETIKPDSESHSTAANRNALHLVSAYCKLHLL